MFPHTALRFLLSPISVRWSFGYGLVGEFMVAYLLVFIASHGDDRPPLRGGDSHLSFSWYCWQGGWQISLGNLSSVYMLVGDADTFLHPQFYSTVTIESSVGGTFVECITAVAVLQHGPTADTCDGVENQMLVQIDLLRYWKECTHLLECLSGQLKLAITGFMLLVLMTTHPFHPVRHER